MKKTEILDRVDADLDAAISRLTELLRIPSISTDPDYKGDCQKAADWLVSDLASLGVERYPQQAPNE